VRTPSPTPSPTSTTSRSATDPRSLAKSVRSPGDAGLPEEGGGGEALLVIFFVATMTMVAAVVLVGSVTGLWVLVPVAALHLGVTFLVIGWITRLLGDDGRSLR
jgi:hypothetical protein